MSRCSICEYLKGAHHPQCPIGQAERADRQHDRRLERELARPSADRIAALDSQQRQFLAQHDARKTTFDIQNIPRSPDQYDEGGRCVRCRRAREDHSADGSC